MKAKIGNFEIKFTSVEQLKEKLTKHLKEYEDKKAKIDLEYKQINKVIKAIKNALDGLEKKESSSQV